MNVRIRSHPKLSEDLTQNLRIYFVRNYACEKLPHVFEVFTLLSDLAIENAQIKCIQEAIK